MLHEAYGFSPSEIFSDIEKLPLGSASIAQVHKAILKNGDKVVIKVQRRGIYETMSRDIGLLHRAVRLLPPMSIKDMVDLDMVLDELWHVAQEEMNFLSEAANMEQFAANNKNVAFVRTPALYKQYTTARVLVMEYIDGIRIDDKDKLAAEGYDLNEVGSKLVDNYIKQVMEDGFFHADPHPGNVMVDDGKIIWMDMGMMGRLSAHDREMVGKIVRGIAASDVGVIQEAVLALGEFKEMPDQSRLYEGLGNLLSKYGRTDMGQIDVAEVTMSLMEVMKENHIIMPHGLTMLARGLTHMEGVLVKIAPDINMVEIASSHMAGLLFKEKDLKKLLKRGGRTAYKSFYKMLELPSLAADILEGYLKGQTRVNMDLHASDDLARLLRRLVRNVVMGLWVMALLISSSIICTTDMEPKLMGIPALGALGYLVAFCIVMYVLLRHIFSKK